MGRALSPTQKAARILGFLYRLSGVLCLALPAYVVYTILTFVPTGEDARGGPAIVIYIPLIFVLWLAFHFFMTAQDILKRQARTRGLLLSTLTTVFCLSICTLFVTSYQSLGWQSLTVTEYYFLAIGFGLGIVNLFCIGMHALLGRQ